MTALARLSANAFVRERPAAAAAPLGLAKRGERLPATGAKRDGWHAVHWNGRIGWVWGGLAKILKE